MMFSTTAYPTPTFSFLEKNMAKAIISRRSDDLIIAPMIFAGLFTSHAELPGPASIQSDLTAAAVKDRVIVKSLTLNFTRC